MMSDQATQEDVAEAQEAEAAASQEDGGGANGAPGTQDGLSGDDAKQLRRDLDAARKEAAKYRSELKKREDADLTEQQKLEREKTTIEAERDQIAAENRNLRAQIAASKVGIRTEAVGDAVKLLDWDEIADPADPKQVEAALKQLVKDKPYLSGRPEGLDGGSGRNGKAAGGSSLTDIVLQATDGRR